MAIIDPISLIPEFNSKDLEFIVENYALSDLYYKSYFPSLPVTNLTFESMSAATGAKVAADIVAFNAKSPRKGRPTMKKETGDIPKIEIARDKSEKDIKSYQILKYQANSSKNPALANQIIDFIYGDSQFVLNGVNARMEWLAKRAASTGKYSLTSNNDGGVSTNIDVDFGIPTTNNKKASVDWKDAANATPIKEIKALQNHARDKGYKLNYALTNQLTIDRMLETEEVKKFCASYVSIALNLQVSPTLETFNSVMRQNNLPQFRVWDSVITFEKKDGSQYTEEGWEDGNILFSANPQLGEIQWSETADSIVSIDESVKAYNDFTLVKVFADQDPITLTTKGIAYAIPVLQGASQLVIFKTSIK